MAKEWVLNSATNRFQLNFSGKIFHIFSSQAGDKKGIVNKEAIDEIRREIDRLTKLPVD